ncbi:MAG: YqaJ viral recombinase family protein [Clostridia bacterium]|nr:YqaJ viral recombinase family protein [Clostridia bacterium]
MLAGNEPLPPEYEQHGTVRYYPDVIQGTDEWFAMRRGLLTASEMHLILTPTLKVAANEKERTHLYELMAQRITDYVEPSYVGDDMMRGWASEDEVRAIYAEHFAPVRQVGFVTNDEWGFTIGYSPDGLVGDDGLIEIKSRRQKFQVQTLTEAVVPPEFMLQIQTGLLVTGRTWCDFLSYCGGLPIAPFRVYPDDKIQAAIVEAAAAFEERLAEKMAAYHASIRALKAIPTERRVEQEMYA